MHKWRGATPSCRRWRAAARTLEFRVVDVGGFFLFGGVYVFQIPFNPWTSSNVLAKLDMVSLCCVILNQWALILLKHCGLYFKEKDKKKSLTRRLSLFLLLFLLFFLGGGVLCLSLLHFGTKALRKNVCNWNAKLWLLILFFFSPHRMWLLQTCIRKKNVSMDDGASFRLY